MANCLDCGKQLKNSLAKRCRPCSSKGILNRNWTGGNLCKNCGNKKVSYKAKWCKKCSIKLQKHNGPDWTKFRHPFLGKKFGPLSDEHKRKISEANSGEKSYLWKGGITSEDRLERVKFRIKIQKQVFERDNYTCQMCGQIGGKLQVDHIQKWSEYVELRFNIHNCRTLCMACHYQITFGRPMHKNIKTWGHNLTAII